MSLDETYRILLVEDSKTQAVALEALLEEQGWTVHWAPTGEEAIDTIASFVPDLILVDYHLPGIRGDEVCRQVRMRIDTRVIAVIMLTVEDSREIEARGLESGADDFIHKSADPARLILRVKALLGRARAHPSILKPTEADLRRARLLAVDDSRTYLTHLEEELGHEGYHLSTTPSAEEALEKLASEEVDCVLVDMIMPGMGGIEMCRAVQEMRRAGKTRAMILMLTAKDDHEGLATALESGADDFVGKSADSVVLKVRIRALLRRKFYETENRRILEELREKQLQVERARIEKEAAEAKAALADELERTAVDLKAANADLAKFAHLASHELQEPLRPIVSYLQLLRRDHAEGLAEEAHEYLDYAIGGALRLQRLIRDLMAFSAAGPDPAAHRPVDLMEAAREAMRELSEVANCEDAEVVIDKLPTLTADPAEIRGLFRHLFDNAVKFKGDGPAKIRVTSSRVSEGWRVDVKDEGIGFEAEYGERIFQAFTRLHGPTEYPGSGVGLALCRKIVERLGGRIRAEGTPGEGAVVSFTLPPSHAAAKIRLAA